MYRFSGCRTVRDITDKSGLLSGTQSNGHTQLEKKGITKRIHGNNPVEIQVNHSNLAKYIIQDINERAKKTHLEDVSTELNTISKDEECLIHLYNYFRKYCNFLMETLLMQTRLEKEEMTALETRKMHVSMINSIGMEYEFENLVSEFNNGVATIHMFKNASLQDLLKGTKNEHKKSILDENGQSVINDPDKIKYSLSKNMQHYIEICRTVREFEKLSDIGEIAVEAILSWKITLKNKNKKLEVQKQ